MKKRKLLTYMGSLRKPSIEDITIYSLKEINRLHNLILVLLLLNALTWGIVIATHGLS